MGTEKLIVGTAEAYNSTNYILCRFISLLYTQYAFLARLYESTGKAIAQPPASALVLVLAVSAALTKMLKFYVKTLYFLNLQMDLIYIW